MQTNTCNEMGTARIDQRGKAQSTILIHSLNRLLHCCITHSPAKHIECCPDMTFAICIEFQSLLNTKDRLSLQFSFWPNVLKSLHRYAIGATFDQIKPFMLHN